MNRAFLRRRTPPVWRCPACEAAWPAVERPRRCTSCGNPDVERVGQAKYGNRRTYVPEIDRTFDSAAEANEARALLWRQQRGEIRGLRFQVTYPLVVNGIRIAAYRADFVFEAAPDWRVVVADLKGFRTPEYLIKRALMRALFGIEIHEVKA